MIRLARPDLGKWGDREIFDWLRSIHQRLSWVSFTWNPPNVPGGSTVSTTLTVADGDFAGLRAGQCVSVTPPSTIDEGLLWGAFVGTDDTVTIRLANATTTDINPVSGTWTVQGWLNT